MLKGSLNTLALFPDVVFLVACTEITSCPFQHITLSCIICFQNLGHWLLFLVCCLSMGFFSDVNTSQYSFGHLVEAKKILQLKMVSFLVSKSVIFWTVYSITTLSIILNPLEACNLGLLLLSLFVCSCI